MSSIYDLLYNNYYPGWSEKLEEYKKSIKNISNIISSKENKYGKYYPEKNNIFNFMLNTPLDTVKVVIWGDKPNTGLDDDGIPIDQGYSYGVPRHINITTALLNIYKEIKANFKMFIPPLHGDLLWLTKQGVLLINKSLTYSPKEPKCYDNLWNRFIDIIITIIDNNTNNCIHLLWGDKCEILGEKIKSKEIYSTYHPNKYGFIGCKHFLKVNITLKRQGKKQINWNEDENLTPTYVENIKVYENNNKIEEKII